MKMVREKKGKREREREREGGGGEREAVFGASVKAILATECAADIP